MMVDVQRENIAVFYALRTGWPPAPAKANPMHAAPDLRSGPPRRWNVAVGGIVWLPRFIDKARALRAGTLGTYLFGQSPVDDDVLKVAGLSYRRFMAIVDAHGADDADVLAEIEAQRPGATERLRLWSEHMPKKRGAHMAILDLDEGYRTAWFSAPVRTLGNALFAPVASLLRKARPVKL